MQCEVTVRLSRSLATLTPAGARRYHHPIHTKETRMRRIAIAALLAAAALPAAAQQTLDFILNWVPGGDHAPYYYAKKLGWYAKEGIDLQLEPGKGSALAVQKVGAGANPIGLADMGNVLLGKAKGADSVAVYNVYANSPQGLYWLKSSGIKGIKDFPGKKIGNPAADGARPMWPALAKANGIDPKSVTWVNIEQPTRREIDYLAQNYPFHPLDLDDTLSRTQRPKLDTYQDYLFLIFHYAVWDKTTRVSTHEQVSIFVEEKYLITIDEYIGEH